MDLLYWIFEYGKVFLGYLVLMFLWPSVVFRSHLKKKPNTYRFAFCITVTIFIVNMLVLLLGLFHCLEGRWIRLAFCGAWTASILIQIFKFIYLKYRTIKTNGFPNASALSDKYKVLPFLEKYILLIAVLIWGMVYFSYGAFQVNSYGYGDLYVHHAWIQGLVEGKVFSGGVYPEAMHCFIYCMHTLFGIRIYSILLFLQGIHAAAFLTAAWLLLRKVFFWRHTPVVVLALFLTIDLNNADLIHSMFRLQITMPMEFGLPAVFLCALCLAGYLGHKYENMDGKRIPLFCWDRNLFLFAMALAVSFMIHFHAAIMAILICAAFAIFQLKKICSPRHLIPLLVSIPCACLVAVLPIAGALKQGIPFHESIHWAVNAMNGEQSREQRGQQGEEDEDVKKDRDTAPNIQRKEVNTISYLRDVLTEIYETGYIALYGDGRAGWIFCLTAMSAVLCLLVSFCSPLQRMRKVCAGYPPVIAASVLYVVVYAAPMLGLPDIIPEGRFFAPGHMMLLAVMAIPLDVICSCLLHFFNCLTMWGLSLLPVAGVYSAAILSGSFRGYLYYEMTRYNSAVMVTNSIIDTYPQYSYTIVSPTDELYQVVQHGWHEELLTFVEKCGSGEYTIPSEYVFIYVEKKPLLYAQSHFFQGPSWLAEEKYLEPYWETYAFKYPDSGTSQSPEIAATEISAESSARDLPEYYTSWDMYLKLDNRTVLESKAYDCCQRFAERYPSILKVYYEDDDFVCYFYKQDVNEGLYELGNY